MNKLLSVKYNNNNKQPLMQALSLCVLLLSGCSSLQNSSSELYQPTPWALEQNRNRLATIESLIQTNRREEAKNSADIINPDELSTEQKAQLNLLYGQIILSFGDGEQALQRFVQIQAQQLSLPDQIKYFQAKSQAFTSVGDFLSSAKSRIDLEPLLTVSEDHKKNQTLIFENLSLVSDNVLQINQRQVASPLAEWLELASILKAKNQNPAQLNAAIMQWRTTYPSHPANSSFLQNHQKALTDPGSRPKSIALLLPESGVFAEAAKAIHAGVMAAYNHENGDPARPVIHFYDSEKQSATVLYNQALEQGANLIVGPLDKEKIQSLANSVQFNIPVLALNHVQGLNKQNLYQFGLSPLDDAEQITNKAWLDGHRNAMVLTQDNEQGKRVAKFLADSWQRKGGKLISKKTYPPKGTDFSFIAKKLPKLNGNKNLNNTAAGASSNTGKTARTRQDIDVILLSAYSDEARLINAQLHTSPVAVYAMSNVYTGRANPNADAALSGVSFCDAPWLFSSAYTGALSMPALQADWSQFNNQYYRLVAMGIDAYYLAGQLNNLQDTPYYGATGKLSLTDNHRIKRNLVCAKFVAGQPELRGFISSAH
ncbi:penicillin-binding protein activator [Crenothrix polyspora]|uniref:LppC family lipoprotein n=1 Tax=Crenothrix polyspora TaxID=360316 RepID=A0A1R4HFY7_9GAMM|nr:penicillin-binding protein activator [Crenothrix polyspora]SJM95134.1 LppC family lipoprotein [Crenothrix polyspora]